jgi:hypothetical protein
MVGGIIRRDTVAFRRQGNDADAVATSAKPRQFLPLDGVPRQHLAGKRPVVGADRHP